MRLYLPAPALGYVGPRPLVYYIHGGPQGQERPDFAWFSMPLIQHLTLNGCAAFVPNVRGSTGYGLSYTKRVDRDWGGQDRLDHVHAMTEVLPRDERQDHHQATSLSLASMLVNRGNMYDVPLGGTTLRTSVSPIFRTARSGRALPAYAESGSPGPATLAAPLSTARPRR